jgi:type VI secretion system secreted protein VgrG
MLSKVHAKVLSGASTKLVNDDGFRGVPRVDFNPGHPGPSLWPDAPSQFPAGATARMSVPTQANQTISVSTPLGPDALLLERVAGFEALSEPFHFRLDLLAGGGSSVDFGDILGQKVTVSVVLDDGSTRSINGVVAAFTEAEQVAGVLGDATYLRYRADVVPAFRLLERNVRSRIFQQLSVPDILKQVLQGLDVSPSLQGTYKPREYCVQYRESDLAFASRLMEDEGIYYYFTHADGTHTMVLSDNPQGHQSVPGNATVVYETVRGGVRPDDRVESWEKTQEVRSAQVRLRDHCFETPDDNLEAVQAAQPTATAGTVSHPAAVAANSGTELYDFPGGYAKRFDGISPSGGEQPDEVKAVFTDNARTAAIRMGQESAPGLRSNGSGRCRQFVAGHKFTLDRHFNADGDYVLTRVELEASVAGSYGTAGPPEGSGYRNRFECLPAAVPFRPARRTPLPKVEGPQTAVVVGTSGQEIFTDKYGRVKVQFRWDLAGKNDAGSSCWVRVGTPWAGPQWGMVHIPRIGHEVVVAFLDGDPDRPIIVGSVYNADNLPPYTLPDDMTQSGLKSRSTLSGTADNYNELRFEDKKGSEQVVFHAERDFIREVENNDSLTVGSSNSQTCPDGSQTISVYKDRTETLQTGDESVTIKKGKRTVTVHADESLTVETGNRTVTISQGNDSLTVTQGDLTIAVNAGSVSVTAMKSIELTVGASKVTVDTQGVSIQGTQVQVQGSATVTVKGGMIALN